MPGKINEIPGKMQSPCKDCRDRELNCWSWCPKYQAFREANNARLAAEKKAKGIENDYVRSRSFKQVTLKKKCGGGF